MTTEEIEKETIEHGKYIAEDKMRNESTRREMGELRESIMTLNRTMKKNTEQLSEFNTIQSEVKKNSQFRDTFSPLLRALRWIVIGLVGVAIPQMYQSIITLFDIISNR